MDLLQTVRKEGSRGGRSEFSWSEVAASAHRENYLGHSLHAPVGRWQRGRDLSWYAKGDNKDGEAEEMTEEQKRKEELKAIKQSEEDEMRKALGLPPIDRSANTEPLGEVMRVLREEEKEDKDDKTEKTRERRHRHRGEERRRSRSREHRSERRRDRSRDRVRDARGDGERDRRRRDDRDRRDRHERDERKRGPRPRSRSRSRSGTRNDRRRSRSPDHNRHQRRR